VQAEVYEQDLGRVKVGQPAVIYCDFYPGERFQGQVTYLGDILDPQTRTAWVRCEVANPEIRLKLDMFASIELPTHLAGGR
jgi:cobalt-zinc-cadmium efflux system membrane fusion protein